jgi:hypothetical protein
MLTNNDLAGERECVIRPDADGYSACFFADPLRDPIYFGRKIAEAVAKARECCDNHRDRVSI